MRVLLSLLTAAALMLGYAATAAAGQPENPGCFGQDRAANNHGYHAGDWGPGSSAWGDIASDRAGTNGEENRNYRIYCGGEPT